VFGAGEAWQREVRNIDGGGELRGYKAGFQLRCGEIIVARKPFFFEKKNQKTLTDWCARCGSARIMSKSFCFFFQKEALSF
jgi:hypothetical protein